MIWIVSKIIDKRKVYASTNKYESYCPPARGERFICKDADARRNFNYFMSQRERRIENLQKFICSFGVEANINADGIKILSFWLHRYGAYLLSDAAKCAYSLSNFDPLWKNDLSGLNVVFDIAILCGEYIIKKDSNVHWNVYLNENYHGSLDDIGYGHACLFGIQANKYKYPYFLAHDIYRICLAGKMRNEKTTAPVHQWSEPDDLFNHIEALTKNRPDAQAPFAHRL